MEKQGVKLQNLKILADFGAIDRLNMRVVGRYFQNDVSSLLRDGTSISLTLPAMIASFECYSPLVEVVFYR